MSLTEIVLLGIAITAGCALLIGGMIGLFWDTPHRRWLGRREAELDTWEATLSPEERAEYRTELERTERWPNR